MSSPSQIASTSTPPFDATAALLHRRGQQPPNPQPEWLYDAINDTVYGADRRDRSIAKIVASTLGVKPKAVYSLTYEADRVPLKAHQIPAFVQATGRFAILDALEAKCGRVAFALPVRTSAYDPLHRELSETVRRFAGFLDENGSALADGCLDAREVQPLVDRIDLVIAALCAYRALVITKGETDAQRPTVQTGGAR